MKTREFEALLRKLENSNRTAERRRLADQLCRAAPRVDAVLRGRFLKTAIDIGLVLQPIDPFQLGVGESWVLLFEAPDRGRVLPFRLETGHSPSSHQSSILRARQGLACAAGRACREFRYEQAVVFDTASICEECDIEGNSLQLSLAAAMLSLATNTKQRTDTACSAAVTSDGQLRPVAHLAEKLRALQEFRPEVTRLIVAEGQPREGLGNLKHAVDIIEVGSVEIAVSHLGLSFESLPVGTIESYQSRVAVLEQWNKELRSSDEWIYRCDQALEAAEALKDDYPEKSARARLWGSLFALHAGYPELADSLVRQTNLSHLIDFPELSAKKAIYEASQRVDISHPDAISSAKLALQNAEGLDARHKNELVGQALGTLGRALMHVGKLVEALEYLRRAQEHHTAVIEKARSACYTSTCLRKMGLLQDARQVLDAVYPSLEQLCTRSDAAKTTRSFLLLERGRLMLGMDRFDDALSDFEKVRDSQRDEHSYPRVGAVRGMASAYRSLGDLEQADIALEPISIEPKMSYISTHAVFK